MGRKRKTTEKGNDTPGPPASDRAALGRRRDAEPGEAARARISPPRYPRYPRSQRTAARTPPPRKARTGSPAGLDGRIPSQGNQGRNEVGAGRHRSRVRGRDWRANSSSGKSPRSQALRQARSTSEKNREGSFNRRRLTRCRTAEGPDSIQPNPTHPKSHETDPRSPRPRGPRRHRREPRPRRNRQQAGPVHPGLWCGRSLRRRGCRLRNRHSLRRGRGRPVRNLRCLRRQRCDPPRGSGGKARLQTLRRGMIRRGLGDPSEERLAGCHFSPNPSW